MRVKVTKIRHRPGKKAAVFHEEAAFHMERDAAFHQFCRLLSDGLRFCEAFLKKYEL